MSVQVDSNSAVFTLADGLKIKVVADISEVDGTPVLFVDTPELDEDAGGPVLRILLNDEPCWENPAYPIA